VLAHDDGAPLRGDRYLVDGASGVFLALIAIVGLCSALVSPAYLRTAGRSWFSAGRSRHRYYAALYAFWAALLAVPIAGNLAVAWLLVEATTAASALLIAFTGARHALEAEWKYLVLTTLGLSVALLRIVVLVAWRVKATLGAGVGGATAGALFLGFGLASVIVAVPFQWRALPWKRLLAYSSLEHMGIVALGIGFGTPLAIAGVVIHVAGHGLAKALGFYAALPLLRSDPDAAHRAPTAVLAASRPTAVAMGVSLGALAGLPPSPLFVSELLILLGGIAAGETAVAAVAAVAPALGFLGLLHALLEGVIGEPGGRRRHARHRSERPIAVMTAALGAGLLALTVGGLLLPGSTFVDTLVRGAL
jgi:formate hydrogenlyase subunit 3/multisubunit Na+/H+ antiporter MnhD subunit